MSVFVNRLAARGRIAFGSAIAAAMLAACGSSGPKIPPLPVVQGPPPNIMWQASVGRAGQGSFNSAVVGGALFAASENGSVVRIDIANGRETWRVNPTRGLSAGVGADDQVVAVGTADGEVFALDAQTGKTLWRARVSSEVHSAPLVLDDLVVVRSADAKLFGFDARDGKRRWVYQRTLPPLTVRSTSPSVGQRGLIYAGFPGGKLVALSSGNGGLRWEATVSSPKGSTELERVSDVVGAPWMAEREICAIAFQGRAACFDTNTGTALWTKELSSRSGMSGDARVLFASDEKGVLLAMDRSTGASLWRQDRLAGRTLSAPIVVGRTVLVGDMQGNVYLMARDTGGIVARIATDGSAIVAMPVAIPGGAVIQTTRGALIALSLPQ